MNVSEFTKIIELIRGAFPHMDRFKDDDVKEVWFECLEDLEYDRARRATLNTIKTAKDFPPDIATIREEYDRLLGIEKHELGEIRRFYEQARSFYPGCGEVGYGWIDFKERAKTKEEAEKLQNLIIAYVNSAESDVIDFVECIRTVRRENGKIVVE
jgi:hypothetical protein